MTNEFEHDRASENTENNKNLFINNSSQGAGGSQILQENNCQSEIAADGNFSNEPSLDKEKSIGCNRPDQITEAQKTREMQETQKPQAQETYCAESSPADNGDYTKQDAPVSYTTNFYTECDSTAANPSRESVESSTEKDFFGTANSSAHENARFVNNLTNRADHADKKAKHKSGHIKKAINDNSPNKLGAKDIAMYRSRLKDAEDAAQAFNSFTQTPMYTVSPFG